MSLILQDTVDCSLLQKGDYITPEQLEQLFGEKRDTKAYAFKLLGLTGEIQRQVEPNGLQVVNSQGGIAILTDAEALQYNQRRFNQGEQLMRRSHSRTLAIDAHNLDDDQRRNHARQCEVQGRLVGAITRERKTLKMTAHERTLPSS